MLSLLFYIYTFVMCTLILVLSAVALVICRPFDPGRRVVHELSRLLVRSFFIVPPLWRTRVEGLEHLDKNKRYIITINHNTVFDITALYFVMLNFRWVSKREVFRVPFFGQFLILHGDICIDRGNPREAMAQMIDEGKLWLSRGASVAIFPEGTRSKDGEIHRFKTGAFVMAKEADVEILPVVMHGTRTIVKKNYLFNWRNTMTVRLLKPVPLERVRNSDPQEVMTEVHDAMCAAYDEVRAQRAAEEAARRKR